MKKITLLSMIAGLIIFMSCGSDGNEFVNKIDIGDLSTGDFAGYYDDDYGTYCLTGPQRADGICATHEGVGFMFTDGDYPELDDWPSNYDFTVHGTLMFPEGQNIAGTYDLMDWNTINSEDRTGDRVATLYANFPEEMAGCCISEVEGTMTIKGSLPNLTISFNVEVGYYRYNQQVRVEEGVNAYVDISGKYKGAFQSRVID